MHYCFLPDDLKRLEQQMAEAREQVRAAGSETLRRQESKPVVSLKNNLNDKNN